jgi:hypothetical protein
MPDMFNQLNHAPFHLLAQIKHEYLRFAIINALKSSKLNSVPRYKGCNPCKDETSVLNIMTCVHHSPKSRQASWSVSIDDLRTSFSQISPS